MHIDIDNQHDWSKFKLGIIHFSQFNNSRILNNRQHLYDEKICDPIKTQFGVKNILGRCR